MQQPAFRIGYNGFDVCAGQPGLRVRLTVTDASGDTALPWPLIWMSNMDIMAHPMENDEVERLLLLVAVPWLAEQLARGQLPPADETGAVLLQVRAVEALAAGGKVCDYQLREGRDLLCGAGRAPKPSDLELDRPVRLSGPRAVVHTSAPLCRDCTMPDARIICSHLLLPLVTTVLDNGGVRRVATGLLCNKDRDKMEDTSRCRAGGHACWERIVEPEGSGEVQVAPLSLHEALDFLAAVWQLAFGVRLLQLRRATPVAALAMPCATRDELAGRMSALADIFKQIEISDSLLREEDGSLQKDHTLARLSSALRRKLDEPGADPTERDRAEAAIDTLRAATHVRQWFQHTGSKPDRQAVDAWARLGVPNASLSWAKTWEIVQARLLEALRTLRDVVQGLRTSTAPRS